MKCLLSTVFMSRNLCKHLFTLGQIILVQSAPNIIISYKYTVFTMASIEYVETVSAFVRGVKFHGLGDLLCLKPGFCGDTRLFYNDIYL